MGNFRKHRGVSTAVKRKATAVDEHSSSVLVNDDEQINTANGERETSPHASAESWWTKGEAGHTTPFVNRGSKSIVLKQKWPTLEMGEVEELSDFLRSLEASELHDEWGFAADVRPPKPKLENN